MQIRRVSGDGWAWISRQVLANHRMARSMLDHGSEPARGFYPRSLEAGWAANVGVSLRPSYLILRWSKRLSGYYLRHMRNT